MKTRQLPIRGSDGDTVLIRRLNAGELSSGRQALEGASLAQAAKLLSLS